ncbi:hypothetical protein VNO77_42708 [Canavalia gladiata]|uniref:Secreted protein n=1 Tax=Canavalia gladiata TaxID=3824 RepID=A0AAN9PNS4_CANGL
MIIYLFTIGIASSWLALAGVNHHVSNGKDSNPTNSTCTLTHIVFRLQFLLTTPFFFSFSPQYFHKHLKLKTKLTFTKKS